MNGAARRAAWGAAWRSVWRAATGILRANPRITYYYLVVSYWTAYAIWRLPHRSAIFGSFVILGIYFGIGWPAALMSLPPYRELLALPLSMRQAGSVLFVLRAVLPTFFLLLASAGVCAVYSSAGDPSTRSMLGVALATSAALPLMTLATFLPLPAAYWRLPRSGVHEGGGNRSLRWTAGIALWVLAPAIALVPQMGRRYALTYWPWLSAILGAGVCMLMWALRERLAEAACRSRPGAYEPRGEAALDWQARGDAARDNPARPSDDHAGGSACHAGGSASLRWRGWVGFAPLLLPAVSVSCALGLAMGVFPEARIRGAGVAMLILLMALSTMQSVSLMLGCARVLRLLPMTATRLSAVMLAMLLFPTLTGVVVGASVANALHPSGIPIAHILAGCLLSLTCNAVFLVPALRSAHRDAPGRLVALSIVPQIAILLLLERLGVSLPPDGWLLAGCLAALSAGFVWLRSRLGTISLRAMSSPGA